MVIMVMIMMKLWVEDNNADGDVVEAYMLSPQSLTLSASTYFTSGYTNTDSLHKIILSIFSIS